MWSRFVKNKGTADNYLDHRLICLQRCDQSIRIMLNLKLRCLKMPHIAALKVCKRSQSWFMWDFPQMDRRIGFNEWWTAASQPCRTLTNPPHSAASFLSLLHCNWGMPKTLSAKTLRAAMRKNESDDGLEVSSSARGKPQNKHVQELNEHRGCFQCPGRCSRRWSKSSFLTFGTESQHLVFRN